MTGILHETFMSMVLSIQLEFLGVRLFYAARSALLILKIVQDFARGFPKLACFLNSDDAFMVYRRFGMVYSRLLLNKQDEICEMEALLLGMDRMDAAHGKDRFIMSRIKDAKRDKDSIPSCWPETRPELLERLEKKALEYGKSS